MTKGNLLSILKDHFGKEQVFSKTEIFLYLNESEFEISPGNLAWQLNKLKSTGDIFQPGRGQYTFDFKPEFIPELSLKTKRLFNRLETEFEGKEIIAWDTSIISKALGEELSKQWIFIYSPKENLEALFDSLLHQSKQVFLDPEDEIIKRYVIPQKEAIIFKPLISEMPTIADGIYKLPSIEAILVNLWLMKDGLAMALDLDVRLVYQKVMTDYNINKNKLLRFAARRDKRKEIEQLLKTL